MTGEYQGWRPPHEAETGHTCWVRSIAGATRWRCRECEWVWYEEVRGGLDRTRQLEDLTDLVFGLSAYVDNLLHVVDRLNEAAGLSKTNALLGVEKRHRFRGDPGDGNPGMGAV